jgi:hypothetical protein
MTLRLSLSIARKFTSEIEKHYRQFAGIIVTLVIGEIMFLLQIKKKKEA